MKLQSDMTNSIFYNDLKAAQALLYDFISVRISNISERKESVEYGAGCYQINGRNAVIRSAKITPKKIGQFVAIWQRNEHGITVAYNSQDDLDLMIINCRNRDLFGQFIFPKAALVKHTIIIDDHKKGKNGMRVYPKWDKPLNAQAIKTQKWQLDYFLDLTSNNIDLERAKTLYSI